MKETNQKSIGKWISALHRQFQIYINSQIKEYGLNSSEYIYLVYLGDEEGINLRTLSKNLMIDPAETTRVIKRLETKGFVTRTQCDKDKRAIIVRLTKKGEDIQPVIFEKLETWTAILSDGLESDEINKFVERLEVMSINCTSANKGFLNEKK